MSDFLKTKNLSIFHHVLDKFSDTKRYEAKIALIEAMMPLMTRDLAFQMMRILMNVIDYPVSDSVLRNNLNPLRVGLMLYRLISLITEKFQYSAHTAKNM